MLILCKTNFWMDSIINSFTARLANIPSHKTVGKNGTFWLPPESTNSFSSKLKDLSSRNSRFNEKSSKNNPAETNSKAKSVGKIQTQSNKGVLSNLNQVTRVRNSQVLQSVNTTSPHPKGMFKGVLARSIPPAHKAHMESLPVHKNVVNRGVEKISSESENLQLKDKENQFLIRDKEEHEGQKNNQNHGTKHAFLHNLMFLSEKLNLILTQASSIAKSENRLHDKSCKLLEYLAKEIASKIACLNKDESKIVRLAFDLPNGSAVRVRIEQRPSSLSISFITRDSETQNVIEFIQEFLGRNENLDTSGALSIYLFKSYQDMDTYFHQAA